MAPATPSIGTTVTDGYSRGIDKIGEWIPSLLVVAGLAGLVSGAVAQAQAVAVPDADEMLRAILMRESVEVVSAAQLRTYQLIGAAGTLASMLISYGALAVFAGAFHAERHGETARVPGPAAVVPAMASRLAAMMPRLATIAGLMLGGLVAPSLLGDLGGFVGLVCWIALLVQLVRWTYAFVIVGSGEATGTAAFERSSSVVRGAWWRTFGVVLVVVIAIALPIGVVGLIVGSLLPGAFLGPFGASFVGTLISTPILASALESAWAQVEAHAGAEDAGAHDPEAAPPSSPPAPEGPFS